MYHKFADFAIFNNFYFIFQSLLEHYLFFHAQNFDFSHYLENKDKSNSL